MVDVNIDRIIELLEDYDNEEKVEVIVQLIANCKKYAEENNKCKTNWIARELFADVLTEEEMIEYFDEK